MFFNKSMLNSMLSLVCNYSELGISNIETEVQFEWCNMEHRQCQEIPVNYTTVVFFKAWKTCTITL